MNVLNRLTFRHLAKNKKRTVVTIIGVILCTAMICGVSTLVGSFRNYMMENAVYSSGDYHAAVTGLNAEQLQQLQDNGQVQDAAVGRIAGYALLSGGKNADKPYLYVEELTTAAVPRLPVHLREGRLPQNPGELLVSAHIASNGGVQLAVGDTLTLELGSRELNGETLLQDTPYTEGETLRRGSSRTYTVVGIMERLGTGTEPFDAPGFTAFSYLDESAIAAGDSLTAYVRLKKPSQAFDNWPAIANGLGGVHTVMNRDYLMYFGAFSNDGMDAAFTSLATILIALIMVGSVSVIYNAFAISTAERKKQFGLLASVGATPKQIRHSVAMEGVFIGLVGIPVGIAAGIGGIAVTLQVVGSLLGDLITHSVPLHLWVSPTLTVLAAAVAAVTIAIAVWVPARRAARTSPMEAIRTTGDIRTGRVKRNRLSRKVFGFEADLALKQTQRNRRRYRATIFSLFISVVLFISFSSFTHFSSQAVAIEFDSGEAEFNVMATNNFPDTRQNLEALYDLLSHSEAVKSLTLTGRASCQWQFPAALLTEEAKTSYSDVSADTKQGNCNLSVSLFSLPDAQFEAYLDRIGLSRGGGAQPQGVAIRETTYYLDGKLTRSSHFTGSVAGAYTLVGDLYDQDGNELANPAIGKVQVLGSTNELPFGLTQYTGPTLVLSQSDAEALARSLNQSPSSYALYASSHDNAAVQSLIDGFIEERKATDTLRVFNAIQQQRDNQRILTIMGIFCYGFIILMALITLTNVLNTISTSMQLRKREFATLQSVGMAPRQFKRMIRFESLFYGFKALLYALPVSFGVSYLLYASTNNALSFAFSLPWWHILGAILGVFAIVFITMSYATAKLRRENIIENIRSEST